MLCGSVSVNFNDLFVLYSTITTKRRKIQQADAKDWLT